jgi:prevent-host-death family protein
MEKEMEKEVGLYEAKNRLSALVEEVASGKRIWITKRGQRVAQLTSGVSADEQTDLELVKAFRRVRSLSKPGKESLKELVEEGRR